MTNAYLNDEQVERAERVERPENRDKGWWIWALLLPMFFTGGWLFNDWWQVNDMSSKTQYGVGGAPGESMWRPSPRVESPLATEPSPYTEVVEDRDSTPVPNPMESSIY